MAHPTLRSIALLLLASAPAVAFQATPTLSPQTFAELRAAVVPSAEELAWKQIPWRASLWTGVIDAQVAEKPILLWAMNGHPLGCT